MNKIIGISIASSWSNKYLPKLILMNNEPEKTPGLDYMDYLTLGELSMARRIGAMKFVDKSIKWKFDMNKIPDISFEKDLEIKIQTFEILNMFFVSNFNEIEKFNLEIVYHGLDSDYTSYVHGRTDSWSFEIRCDNVCFNIFNFVNNLFNGNQYFQKLHTHAKQLFKSYADDIDDVNYNSSLFEDMFEKLSLKNQFTEWDRKTEGFALPFYSLDMMYNIFKRQYVNNRKDYRVISINDLFKEIVEVYLDIGELLKAEDQFYFSDAEGKIDEYGEGINRNRYRFYDNYITCPFIKFFCKLT